MASFFPAQPACRIVTPGTSYSWAGTGVSASSAVGNETFMVRVITQIAGYITIGTTSDPTIASTLGVGTYIPVATSASEYFKCNFGQKVIFASTTTSSGGVWNMTEMS